MENQFKKRTDKEIEELKREWCDDPCWDLESTEGFEAHHDELKSFSDKHKAEWKAKLNKRREAEEARLRADFEKLGDDALFSIFKMVMSLKEDLNKANDRIHNLECPPM